MRCFRSPRKTADRTAGLRRTARKGPAFSNEHWSAPFRARGKVVYWSHNDLQGTANVPRVCHRSWDSLSDALDDGSRGMNTSSRVWLALPLVAMTVLPARAQVTVDVSKITCEQYVLFTVADPHDIAMWLSGYYNGQRNNTVLDTQAFRAHAKQVMDFCQLNLKSTVMDAVQKVLGIGK
jgi:hypothetical protein